MNLLVTALYEEAKPFIEITKCKKAQDRGNLNVYANDKVSILITGYGKVPAAVAVSRLLQSMGVEPLGHIVNVGICGASDTSMPIGSIHLMHTLTDQATGRNYFPDRLYASPYPEGTLITVDQGQSAQDARKNSFYDMEASGVFQAATQFVTSDRVHFLKVVSDHLEPEAVTPQGLQETMKQAAPSIMEFVDSLPAIESVDTLQPVEQKYLEQIQKHWKLTQTQFHQLKDATIYHNLTNPDVDSIEELTHFINRIQPQTSSKSARNQAFATLLNALGT